jgi:nicotinate-nucleotide--dimethylbenzimidazole phosphoribosyltransferase
MSSTRVLVLGGFDAGQAEFAETLLGPADRVTRLDVTEPDAVSAALSGAAAGDVLLVSDLDEWVTELLDSVSGWADRSHADDAIRALADALAGTAASRVVLVSREVGLAVPAGGRDTVFAAALAKLNRSVAEVCDRVVLVVAGQTAWLKGGPAPATVTGAVARPVTPIEVDAGIPERPDLVVPDETTAAAAGLQLQGLDFVGAGLGALTDTVRFAGGTQGRAAPQPWRSVRVLLLHGVHAGGGAAGDNRDSADRRIEQAHEGVGALALLAGAANASISTVECPPATAMETGDALTAQEVEEALAHGWKLAEAAVDEGADALVLAALGTGSEAAAVALSTLTAGGEPAALLDRVVSATSSIDDVAWMSRCVAVRDALHRVRTRPRDPRSLLAMVGGGDIAVAAGIILGATYRHTPVLIDGPVGIAAALAARDIGPQSRLWLSLPDHGGHPLVRFGGDVLGLTPVLHLRLRLGEGTTALAALPLLNAALAVSAGTPARPQPPLTDDPGYVDYPTAELPLVKQTP